MLWSAARGGRDDKVAGHVATIREIGDNAALDRAMEDAFPGSRVNVRIEAGWFEVEMQQQGLLRPLRALGRLIVQGAAESQTIAVSHAPALIEALQSHPECRSIALEMRFGETRVAGDDDDGGVSWL